MATFTDLQGHAWNLAITIADARRLKSEGGIDILDPKSLQETTDDLYLRFDLIAGICADQIAALGITAKEFDVRLADAAVHESACRALREALTDFFLRAGRPDLARVMDRIVEAADRLKVLAVNRIDSPRVNEAIETAIRDAEAEMDKAMDRELAKIG